jgi:hypothetical protein
LVIKRSPEGYQKQSHSSIAKALADSLIQELSVADAPYTRDTFAYWNGVLTVLKEMLIDGMLPPSLVDVNADSDFSLPTQRTTNTDCHYRLASI